jgi:hypothetical protein
MWLPRNSKASAIARIGQDEPMSSHYTLLWEYLSGELGSDATKLGGRRTGAAPHWGLAMRVIVGTPW